MRIILEKNVSDISVRLSPKELYTFFCRNNWDQWRWRFFHRKKGNYSAYDFSIEKIAELWGLKIFLWEKKIGFLGFRNFFCMKKTDPWGLEIFFYEKTPIPNISKFFNKKTTHIFGLIIFSIGKKRPPLLEKFLFASKNCREIFIKELSRVRKLFFFLEISMGFWEFFLDLRSANFLSLCGIPELYRKKK